MTRVYETATITRHPGLGGGKGTLDIAYEQGGRHFRRCAACAGFHPVRSRRDRPPMPGDTVVVVDDLAALRGRIPARLCPYRERRGQTLPFYAACVERGEEPEPLGFPEAR
jgi:hypothetical protein